MSSSHEQNEPNTSEPSSEGDKESVYQYYERFLKNMHPNWSDDERRAYLEEWLSDEFRVSMVEGMMEADQMIREQFPQYQWQSMADLPQWLKEWREYVKSLENKVNLSSDED